MARSTRRKAQFWISAGASRVAMAMRSARLTRSKMKRTRLGAIHRRAAKSAISSVAMTTSAARIAGLNSSIEATMKKAIVRTSNTGRPTRNRRDRRLAPLYRWSRSVWKWPAQLGLVAATSRQADEGVWRAAPRHRCFCSWRRWRPKNEVVQMQLLPVRQSLMVCLGCTGKSADVKDIPSSDAPSRHSFTIIFAAAAMKRLPAASPRVLCQAMVVLRRGLRQIPRKTDFAVRPIGCARSRGCGCSA
jgi:hypothetical protein